MVITIALSLFQFVAAIRTLQLPDDLPVSLLIPLEVAAGFSWGLLFALATVALILYKPYAARFALWLTLSFLVYSVIRLTLFAQSDYDRQRLPFLIVTLFVIIILAWLKTRHTERRYGSRPED
jgi:uncharacterized membrane protein YhaH (DUF805 family)